MSKKLFYLLVFIIHLSVVSCNGEAKSDDEKTSLVKSDDIITVNSPPDTAFKNISSYLNWYVSPESGNKITQVQNGCVYEMNFLPELVLALENLPRGTYLNNDFIDRINSQTIDSGNWIFHLKISGDIDKNSFRTERSIQEYFAFESEKHFRLVIGEDTISPSLVHYENTYPQLPYLSLMLVFNRVRSKQINQQILFTGASNGPLIWIFNKNILFYQPSFKEINDLWP